MKFFGRGGKILSDSFTEDRSSLPPNYLNDPVLRSGYLLYFLPVNFLKVHRILSEFSPDEMMTGKVRVLDVGSGPGTGMFSLMHWYASAIRSRQLKESSLDFTLIDRNFNILKDAKALHDLYRAELRAKFQSKSPPPFDSTCSPKNFDLKRGGIDRFLRGFRYHLIVVENLLNEFSDNAERAAFIETLIRDHLEPKKGKIVIVEPASRKTSRDLQVLRDELVVAKKSAFVHAPCLHQEVCPLNVANGRDWCHFYFDWEAPDFINKVDRLIGNRKEFLACSYLVLGREPRVSKMDMVSPSTSSGQALSNHGKGEGEGPPRNIWRVISNPLPSKGKRELILCGPPGRYRVTRLDRDKGAPKAPFDRIGRGDLVEISAGERSDGYTVDGNIRLEKTDPVRLVGRL